MTRKDYILIANAIHRSRMVKEMIGNAKERAAALSALRLVTTDLAATLKHDNPLFDGNRFQAACGFSAREA